ALQQRFSRPTSSRNCRSSRNSLTPTPIYLRFHRSYAAWLIPTLRQTSSCSCFQLPQYRYDLLFPVRLLGHRPRLRHEWSLQYGLIMSPLSNLSLVAPHGELCTNHCLNMG